MQWWDESYQHHQFTNINIDVKKREKQRLFMKRSDFKADSISLKCLRKEDWKLKYIYCKKCIKVKSIHSTF